MGKTSRGHKRVLPQFPVVRLGLVGDQITASLFANDTRQLGPTMTAHVDEGKVGSAAGEIAAKLAGEFTLRWCRVEATDSAGKVDLFAVDVAAKKLVGMGPDGAVETGFDRQGRAKTSRKNIFLGVGIIAVTVVLLVGGLVALMPVIGGRGGSEAEGATTVPAAGSAAQLPVTAPAGFGTFAPWAVPAGGSSSDTSVRVVGNQVVVLSGDRVSVFDAGNGAKLGQATTGYRAGDLVRTDLGNGSGIGWAVYDRARSIKPIILNQVPGQPVALGSPVSFPQEVRQITFGGDRPLGLTTSGTIAAGGQAYTIDDGGSIGRRYVPGQATALASMGGKVFAVDPGSKQAWWLVDESVRSPSPVAVSIPGGAQLSTRSAGVVMDGWWIASTATGNKDNSGTIAARLAPGEFAAWTEPSTGVVDLSSSWRKPSLANGLTGLQGPLLCTAGAAAWNIETGKALAAPEPRVSSTSIGCGGGRWWWKSPQGVLSTDATGKTIATAANTGSYSVQPPAPVVGLNPAGFAVVVSTDPNSPTKTGPTWVFALEPQSTGTVAPAEGNGP